MRVIITGGRDYSNRERLFSTLDAAGITVCIQGECYSGADKFARAWAKSRGVPCEGYVADWAKHGRAAGPRRNQEMIEKADAALVIAFRGGRGTRDCVERAEAYGIPVTKIGWE